MKAILRFLKRLTAEARKPYVPTPRPSLTDAERRHLDESTTFACMIGGL